MKLIPIRGTGGSLIFVDVTHKGKKLRALVDTGSTSCVVSNKIITSDRFKVSSVTGIGGDLKAKEVGLKIEINGITKKINCFAMDFTSINDICDNVGIKHYDLIIGIKQIKQFNLSKKLYDTLRNKR